MKLWDLKNSSEAIGEILKVSLPAKVAFRLALAVKKAASELDSFNKIQEEKIREYGEDIGDNKIQVTAENYPKFVSEMNELLNQEVIIEGFTPVSIEEFGDAKIEPRHFISLDWLITV